MKFLTTVLFILLSSIQGYELQVLTEEMPPYNYSLEPDSVHGFSTELLRTITEKSNVDIQNNKIKVYPWARAYLKVQEMPNSCLYTMTRTEERDTLFKWVGPIAKRTIFFWRLKNRTDIVVNRSEDLKNYRIGAVREFSSTKLMKKMELNLDLSNLEGNNFLKLIHNRVDMITALELAASYHMNNCGHSFSELEKVYILDESHDYYFAFNRAVPDSIIALLQQSLNEVRADGTYDQLWQDFLEPHQYIDSADIKAAVDTVHNTDSF